MSVLRKAYEEKADTKEELGKLADAMEEADEQADAE